MNNKSVILQLSLLMAIVVIALIGISPARQAWLINVWSLQYIHYVFSPEANQSMLLEPPPGHKRAMLWIASDALKSGNPALAETLIAEKASRGDQLAMPLMVDALLAQGDFAGAVNILKQAGEVDLLLKVALQAKQAGRMEEALMANETAWTLDMESGTLPLATFLLNYTVDYGRAENVLRQSLVSIPNSKYWLDWYCRLGDALLAQKHWDGAEAIFESVIAQSPDHWEAYISLGWARYERGDGSQAAKREFQRATNYLESRGRGQYEIAQMLIREKRFEEADEWFVRALVLNPYPWWYLARGDAARQAGNPVLALGVYQEILDRFPNFESEYLIYYDMAITYRSTNKPTQAVAAIEEALVQMKTPNASYYSLAGSIYDWVGDETRALNAYRQALLIDPQNTAALKGIESLDK